MRQHNIRGLAGRIAAALVIAVATVTGCAARAATSPVEAGAPSDLINTPFCAAVGSFEDARDCSRIGWPEGSSRPLYQAIR
jgi:hypothetical protein